MTAGATIQALLMESSRAAAVTFISHGEANTTATTATFTAQAIGPAASDRIVFVGVAAAKNSGGWAASPISSVTIAGNGATLVGSQVLDVTSGGLVVALYQLLVTAGTTANIVVTAAAAMFGTAIAVWYGNGLQSTTPTATASANNAQPVSSSIVVPSGGFTIGMVGNGGATSFTWTNATEASDAAAGAAPTLSSASTVTPGTPTISANPAAVSTSNALTLASFR